MLYLITKWFGIFLIDDDLIINKIIFPKDPKKIAKILNQIESGDILKEELKLSKDKIITVNDKRLIKIGKPASLRCVDELKKEKNWKKRILLKYVIVSVEGQEIASIMAGEKMPTRNDIEGQMDILE